MTVTICGWCQSANARMRSRGQKQNKKHTRKHKTHIAAVFLHLLAPVTRTRMHTHSRMHHSTCTRAHKHTRKHTDTHTHAHTHTHQCNIFCLYPPDRNTAPSPALGHSLAQRSLAHHQCILNQLQRRMNSTSQSAIEGG